MAEESKEVYPGEKEVKEVIERTQKELDEKAAFMRRFEVNPDEEPTDDVPTHNIPPEHNVPPEKALEELERTNS